jgi:hypothetical protein
MLIPDTQEDPDDRSGGGIESLLSIPNLHYTPWQKGCFPTSSGLHFFRFSYRKTMQEKILESFENRAGEFAGLLSS